jgi:hypothetical protein
VLGLTLLHPRDFGVGNLRALERVLDHRVRAVQLLEVAKRGLDRRPRVLDAGHLGARVARGAVHLVEVAPQALHAAQVLVHAHDVLGQRLKVSGDRGGLRLQLAGELGRFAQRLVAVLEVVERAAQVRDPLAHRLEATALEVEALDRLLHLLLHRREVLARGARPLVGAALELGDLARVLEHVLVQRAQGRDLILHRAQDRLVVLLLADARVDLTHRAVELVGLADRALDGLALCLERRALLRHDVAERLERLHLAADVVDGVLDAVHGADGLLDAGDAPLLVLHVAAVLLAAPVQRLHLGHRHLVRVEHAIVLLAQARHLLTGRIDLVADRLGVAAQQLERLLDLEERLEPVLERDRDVHLAAQLLEDGANALAFLNRARDLGLGLLLSLRQVLGALVEREQLRRQLGHRLETLLQAREAVDQLVHVGADLDDRFADLLDAFDRGVGALDHGIVALSLALELGENPAHLFGDFTVLRAVPEQTLEDCHRSLPCRGADRPGPHRTAVQLRREVSAPLPLWA